MAADGFRVLVCGGRDYDDRDRVFSELDTLQPIRMVIHGNARGADTLAQAWCLSRRVQAAACPAQWSKYGKRAGPMRNEAMLGHSPDLVLAFPGGRGTADMVSRARKAGVRVVEVSDRQALSPNNPAGQAMEGDHG